jgi:hypothetical protein
MSALPTCIPSDRKSPLRKLIVLTAVVVAVHALVLGGMPTGVSVLAVSVPDSQPMSLSVVPSAIAPEQTPVKPLRAPVPPPAKANKAAALGAPPKIAAQNTIATEAFTSTVQATLAKEPAAIAPVVVPEAPAVLAVPAVPEVKIAQAKAVISAPKPTANPTVPPIAEVPRVQKLAYAPPELLIYDGKGEKDGFIKYSLGGELLWVPDGSHYNAHLEISALGFRVRTWSSKGDLTDGGLQPLRFGDKPRGAELATHFQREKGIISFSANNPDVPLQTGAQDKLSAILQLSAIVAGEPERYASGASITFQAADAHRAELWHFKVGGTEPLDLPGGAVTALKLSKEPTVEFDQRIEVWLAPDLRYMPVRIRITEANGDYADLLWRKTQTPN